MPPTRTLFLHEEILLLALRDRDGSPECGTWYPQALGGAILAELLLRERISVDDTKAKTVSMMNAEPVGDPVIDECLDRIRSASKPRGAEHWVSHFTSLPDLKNRVAEGLCDRGILKSDVKTVLLIFSRKVHPEIDPQPELDIVERLRTAIFDHSAELDVYTMVLVSLANATGILAVTFGKKVIAAEKARLEQIASGEGLGDVGRDSVVAVEAMQAAQAAQAAVAASMMLLVTMPIIMSN